MTTENNNNENRFCKYKDKQAELIELNKTYLLIFSKVYVNASFNKNFLYLILQYKICESHSA